MNPTLPSKGAYPERIVTQLTPRFTISMLCHNHVEMTKRCVRSVLKWSKDFELLITNNGSYDETQAVLDELAQADVRVRVQHNPDNQGFQEPNKEALRRARGEFFVLLNNDTEVCEGWLEKLAEPFQANPRVAISGMAGTCCTIDSKLHGQALGCEGRTEPEYVEGSCLCIPTALARRVGLFAPWLSFIYWEDTELSLRVRELGYEIALVKLEMKHDKPGTTSSTVPECQEALERNTEAMKQRYSFYWKRRELKRRILVRRLGARGDVLLATPALWALRQRYPLAEIDVVTKHPEMLAGLGWLKIAKRKRDYYDEFYDLDRAYEERPDLHIVEAFAQKLGVTLPKRWQMQVATSAQDEAWAERTTRGTKMALLHAGPTAWPSKNWPVERWQELVKELRGRGYLTLTVGDDNAPPLGSDLHLGGQTALGALYALAKQANLFVGIDSMPQHVASAADCPSVVLFGPTNPRCIVRSSPRIIPVFGDVEVTPCIGEHGRRTTPITSVPCPGDCIRAVTLPMVLGAIGRVERLTA